MTYANKLYKLQNPGVIIGYADDTSLFYSGITRGDQRNIVEN